MKRPNHIWDEWAQCFRYPSGEISVTIEEMYSSVEKMRAWGAIGVCTAIAWMIWGTSRWFTQERP